MTADGKKLIPLRCSVSLRCGSLRRFGHKLINLATSVPSGIYVSDSQIGLRAFSARAIELIQFTSDDFSVESEMQFLAQEHGMRVVEVPITINYTDTAKHRAQDGRGHAWVFVPKKNEPKRI